MFCDIGIKFYVVFGSFAYSHVGFYPPDMKHLLFCRAGTMAVAHRGEGGPLYNILSSRTQ